MSYKYIRGGTYQSRNKKEIEDLTKEFNSREFDYNPAADNAYRDYARMMAESGQKAMTDTMGKAAAMTGGYGNSYAATAGQQVYNDYMAQAAAAQTDFEDRAYARFANENARLMDKIGMLENQETKDKAAWEEDYLNDLNAATMRGDTAALAQIYGMTEQQYIDYADEQYKASLAMPTQEIIDQAVNEYMAKGYLGSGEKTAEGQEALIDGIVEKYVEMGYNPDAITSAMLQARDAGEYVTDRQWTYVSGGGKNAIFTDQYGNQFYQEEILDWAKNQGASEEDIKTLKKKLKGMY